MPSCFLTHLFLECTQQKYTTIPASFSLYNDKYIFIIKSSLSDLAGTILIKAEEESEFGLTCSTHCSPIIIAV